MSTERSDKLRNPYWWQWHPAEHLGVNGIREHQSFGHIDSAHSDAWNNLDLALAKKALDQKGALVHFEQSNVDFELLAQEKMDLRQMDLDDFQGRLGYAYIPVYRARLESRSPALDEVQETHYRLMLLGSIVLSSIREFPLIDPNQKYQALTYAVALQLLTRCYSEDNDYYLPQLSSPRELSGGYHAYLRPWNDDNEPMRLQLYGKRKRHPSIFRMPLFHQILKLWETNDASTALSSTQAELYNELSERQYSKRLDKVSKALMDSIYANFSRTAPDRTGS